MLKYKSFDDVTLAGAIKLSESGLIERVSISISFDNQGWRVWVYGDDWRGTIIDQQNRSIKYLYAEEAIGEAMQIVEVAPVKITIEITTPHHVLESRRRRFALAEKKSQVG